MDYSDFIKTIKDANIYCYLDTIEVEWTTGGQWGGRSCWGCQPSDYSPRQAEPEPELEELDKVLELFCPNISFLQYKNLLKTLVIREDGCEHDYYGNDREYTKKSVNLEQLYYYLVDKGWISGH